MSAQVHMSYKRSYDETSSDTPTLQNCGSESRSYDLHDMKRVRMSDEETSDEWFDLQDSMKNFKQKKHPILIENLRNYQKLNQITGTKSANSNGDNIYMGITAPQPTRGLLVPVFQASKKKDRKYTESEVQDMITEALQQHEEKLRLEYTNELNRFIKGMYACYGDIQKLLFRKIAFIYLYITPLNSLFFIFKLQYFFCQPHRTY